jgi:hypothetical protein
MLKTSQPFLGKVFKGKLKNADKNQNITFRTHVAMAHFTGNFVLNFRPRQQFHKSGLFFGAGVRFRPMFKFSEF